MSSRRFGRRWGWLTLALLLMGHLAGAAVGAGAGKAPVVLAYFVTQEATTVSVIGDGGVTASYTVAISSDELKGKVEALRVAIAETGHAGSGIVGPLRFLQQARDLYDLLVAPVEVALVGAGEVVVVPSGPLFYLPFAALYRCVDCEGQDLLGGDFLVERSGLSYATGLAEAVRRNCLPEAVAGTLVIRGSERDPGEVEAPCSWTSPCTLIDSARIPEGGLAGVLKGTQFSAVHVMACTLELQAANPLESTIRLGLGLEAPSPKVSDLVGLGLSADLLTLSASLTFAGSSEAEGGAGALPEMATGEEFRSVVDALLASGATHVVAPLLSPVSNPATAALMSQLYEGITAGLSPSEAFRAAQLALLQGETGRFLTSAWASFVLYGRERPLAAPAPAAWDKLDSGLLAELQGWTQSERAPGDRGPTVSVVASLERPATQEDLDLFRGISDAVSVQGTYGAFVLLELPLADLDGLARLSEVRSISAPFGTIPD